MIYKFGDQRSQDHLESLKRASRPHDVEYTEMMYHKATGYGWGRTDSPGYVWPQHKGDALDFGINYAIHTLTPGATHALREAFDMWHAGIGLDKVPDECTCDPCAGCRQRLTRPGHCPECPFCLALPTFRKLAEGR